MINSYFITLLMNFCNNQFALSQTAYTPQTHMQVPQIQFNLGNADAKVPKI